MTEQCDRAVQAMDISGHGQQALRLPKLRATHVNNCNRKFYKCICHMALALVELSSGDRFRDWNACTCAPQLGSAYTKRADYHLRPSRYSMLTELRHFGAIVRTTCGENSSH